MSRHHPARRARAVAGSLSAAAAVAITGWFAAARPAATTASAARSSQTSSDDDVPEQVPATAPVSPFAHTKVNPYPTAPQPAVPSFPANTRTRGS